MSAKWHYQVVEEPNPVALQERLATIGLDGWEPIGLGYAGECRLLALVRRPATNTGLLRAGADDVSRRTRGIDTTIQG